MPSRDHIVAAIDEYCRAETEKDKRAWLALFSNDIVHEDPVGVSTNRGPVMLEAFWESFQSMNVELRLTAPTIVCGNEAIAFMAVRAGPDDDRREISPIIDNMVFNEDGKIVHVRAFYES